MALKSWLNVVFLIFGVLCGATLGSQSLISYDKEYGAQANTTPPRSPNITEPKATVWTTRKLPRTPPKRETFQEHCEHKVRYCLRVYNTGKVCGRTIRYHYKTFTTYCMLDFVNCIEGFEFWQIFHMGPCFNLPPVKVFTHFSNYEYTEDAFLDQTYVYYYDI